MMKREDESKKASVNVDIVATKERKHAKTLTIFFVLLMSAIGAMVVFLYSKHLEDEQFQSQFYADGNKVCFVYYIAK
jgi:hypothetical protein